MNPIGPPVLHRFEGGGLTGYLLLSESHIALHTYPEHRYLALDIFSCGRADSKAALSVFLAVLEPGREQITTAPRGAEISRAAIENLGFGPHRVACEDQDPADGIRRSTPC
jgi:S-adenosylmethionine/arginine decarboxylase-like enzyme